MNEICKVMINITYQGTWINDSDKNEKKLMTEFSRILVLITVTLKQHMTGKVVQVVLRAYRKITIGIQERKRTPSFNTMAAFSFICRSIPKLLDEKSTGFCQFSETCHNHRVLHNLGCLKDVVRWQSH